MVDDAETKYPQIEDGNFSRCIENAVSSALEHLLERKLTDQEKTTIQDINRGTVPDRRLLLESSVVRETMSSIFKKILKPYGYAVLPRVLNSASEVAEHLQRGEQVLLVFPILAGQDTHVSHVTRYLDGKLFYTNDVMFTFRPNEMDSALHSSASTFDNLFNSFVIKKTAPFPGLNS